MKARQSHNRPALPGLAAAAVILLSAFSGIAAADDVKITLGGDQEVPPVATAAKGSGTITVNSDMSVRGSVTTTGMTGTIGHIHQGAAGKNGPPIVTLKKDGDTWTVPADAKLTEAQYQAYKAGELYVNVHSAAHKNGEVRGQIK